MEEKKKDWYCHDHCRGAPEYGYECPSDLDPDEICPMGILIEEENEICI